MNDPSGIGLRPALNRDDPCPVPEPIRGRKGYAVTNTISFVMGYNLTNPNTIATDSWYAGVDHGHAIKGGA
jgi:hypothetical protein